MGEVSKCVQILFKPCQEFVKGVWITKPLPKIWSVTLNPDYATASRFSPLLATSGALLLGDTAALAAAGRISLQGCALSQST